MRHAARRRERVAQAAIAFSPALLFLILTGTHGIQGLRHDWPWIPNSAGFISSAFATLSWRPDGVGAPRPYPTDYLLAMLDTAIVSFIGVKGLYPLFMLGTSAICVYGARSLAQTLGAGAIARFGISLFALYNPWVYTEFVAGHLGMIIAYGATLGYLGTALRTKPSVVRLSLFICISAAQLQFFLILIALAACGAIAKRGFLPLATGLVVALPTVVGVLGNRSMLAAIPYNLTWQAVQSLPAIDAAALTGYFAHYVAGFPPVTFDAVWAMGALAAIGLVVGTRKTVGIAFLLLGIVAWLWSTGSTGPIGPAYAFAIVRLPALAIFRELYDLLAYVAIAYVALASSAAAGNRWLSVLAVAPGLVLAITWCLVPPLRWLVPLRELPAARVSAPERTRVAFMPDVQPLTFGGRGSGLDPDAYPRPNDVLSLNGLDASYPANVALRRYAVDGVTTELAALGVSRIVSRPWLSTDIGSASATFAVGATLKTRRSPETVVLSPLPELSTFYALRIAEVPPPIGSAAIFFGDGAGVVGRDVPAQWKSFERPTIPRASRSALRAADAWVDVRLAYLTQPELGQGLGGLITTSKTAYLSLEPGRSALVWVRGRLLDAKQRVIARATSGYRWVNLGADSSRVRCAGECVVVAQANVPRGIDSAVPAAAPRSRPVDFRAPLPWLAVAVLPPAASVTLLRYAVGFDAHWLAIASGVTFAHVRVETALNGWIVPAHAAAQRVVLVESVAAAQLGCEVVALVWTLWLCYRLALSAVASGRLKV